MTARSALTAARGALVLAAVLSPSVRLAAAAPPHRYLVLPFENLSAERSLNWIGEALALSLGDRLEAQGMFAIPRAERVDATDSFGLSELRPVTLATTLKIVAATRSDRFITGSFTFDPKNGVVVSYRIFDAARAREIWDGSSPGTLAGVFFLTDPLVAEAARRDGERSAQPSGAPLVVVDPPLTIYEILVRALQESEPERRLAALQKALDLDRRSAVVRRAIALEQIDQGLLANALASLEAIQADGVADAWRLHLLRARILAAQGNLEGASASLSRSIGMRDSAEAHLLLARLAATRGDSARAAVEIDLATGLDPTNPEIGPVKNLSGKPPVTQL